VIFPRSKIENISETVRYRPKVTRSMDINLYIPYRLVTYLTTSQSEFKVIDFKLPKSI